MEIWRGFIYMLGMKEQKLVMEGKVHIWCKYDKIAKKSQ